MSLWEESQQLCDTKSSRSGSRKQEVARKWKFVRTSICPLQAKRQVLFQWPRFSRQSGSPASVSAFPPRQGTSAGLPRAPTDAYQTYFYRSNVIFFFSLYPINDFPLSRALNLCVFWQTNLGANQFCTVKMEIMTFCGFSLQRSNRIYSLVRGDACRYSPSTICKWQTFSLSHGSFSSSHNKQKWSFLVSCEPPLSMASISPKKKNVC